MSQTLCDKGRGIRTCKHVFLVALLNKYQVHPYIHQTENDVVQLRGAQSWLFISSRFLYKFHKEHPLEALFTDLGATYNDNNKIIFQVTWEFSILGLKPWKGPIC